MITKEAIRKRLLESASVNHEKVYEIKCIDDEGKLMQILEAIKALGQAGHSCNIVIDPGTKNETMIFYDGDGSDRIHELNVKE